ncbi:RNA-binding S4 domain-containing protein [Klebsiella pneumoniae]|uniref:RNA-binding S4 domain-containing protein n=1 Tax=Klebsiella pneumoniae TaxID=573 RepID=A0A2X3FFS9_KLEPN|nr:RNA-binding S4 domain-containing protein [Klebsiella pneumoniae]
MKEKPTETVRLDKWLWAARFLQNPRAGAGND